MPDINPALMLAGKHLYSRANRLSRYKSRLKDNLSGQKRYRPEP